jgi:hypothetical protein
MVLQNKSDNSTVHHALQNCQIRMVFQNKSDSSNGHALKSSNFRMNLSFWRCFIAETYPVPSENFLGNENFQENENFRETKFRENLLIFAFRENGKKTFSFQPYSQYTQYKLRFGFSLLYLHTRPCSIWIAWQRSSPMKGELRWRGPNSISKFDHHYISGGAVDDTWRHR